MDRVLDVAEHTDPNTGKTIKHYLVKWRSMQYEDSTWELEEDVDPIKIEHFLVVNKKPPKDKWKVCIREKKDFCSIVIILTFLPFSLMCTCSSV